MTEARLGFAIDSSQAAGAASDLDRLTASSGKAEQAANKVSLAATKASRGFADISPALERVIAGISRLEATANSIDQRLAAMAKGAQSAAAANRMLADSTNSVQAAQSKGSNASALATATITRQTQAVEKLAAANKRAAQTAANSNELSEGNRRFIGRDIGFQLQDIAVTAAGGMSPKMIALQQGTQIAGAVQGLTLKQTGQALAGAFAGVLNPVALAAIAITGLSATAIQFFTNGTNKAKSLEDALKSTADTLDLLKDKYGDLAKVSASVTSVGGNSFVLSDARTQQIALNATLRQQLGGFLGATNDTSLTGYAFSANSMENVKSLQNLSGGLKQFSGPVQALLNTVKIGSTPLDEFNRQVENLYANLVKTSSDPQGLRGAADAVESLADAAFSVTGKFKPFQDAINVLKVQGVDGLAAFADQVHRIGEEKGISKLADELISKGGDIVKLAQQAETLRRTLQAIDREDTRPGLRDRDNLQAYVARRAVDLRRLNEQFSADQQQQDARTFSERLAAAERVSRAQRPANADEGGGADARAARAVEAERNRQARELRDAAFNRSLSMQSALADQQQEIDLIGKTGAEQAALQKQYELTSQIRQEALKNGIEAEGRFNEVYSEELKNIQAVAAEYGRYVAMRNQATFDFEFGRSRADARLSDRDRQIVQTQRQYGLQENPNDANGQAIGSQLDWQDAKNTAKQFGSVFSNELISGSHNIGKAFLKGFQTTIENEAQKLWSKLFDSLGNVFADWITGSKGSAGTQASAANGIGAIGAKIFGAGTSSAAQAAQTTQTGVAAQAWNFFASKGLQSHQIAGVLGNMSAESALNPKAVGDSGNALGLFQWNDRAPKMLSAIGGRQNLGDVNSQLNYAWSELQGPENKAFKALMNSTDVRGATAAFAGFERPQGFSWANPEGAHNFSGRLDAANDALSKFGSTTNQATQGLGALGNGLGQLGSSIGGSVAGSSSLLSQLSSPNFTANTSLGAVIGMPGAQQSSGGGLLGSLFSWIPKLFHFADGTNYAPGGVSLVGENGPELLNLPQGSQVTSNHKLMSALAANTNQPRQNQTLMVNVQGASGDDHVRTLVQQGVGAALSDYNTQQRRGGIGVLQARYGNQKG